MARAKKPDFVFRQNERVNSNLQGRQFSRILAAEVCASAVVMLYTLCSEVVWRVLATHSIRQFPLYFPTHASPWALTTAIYLWLQHASYPVPIGDVTHRVGFKKVNIQYLIVAL